MFVDSHCHLSSSSLLRNIEQVIAQMTQACVTRALCVSTSLKDFETVIALTREYPQLWASIGVHPNEDQEIPLDLDDLCQRALLPRVVAIGETGLDYYRQKDTSPENIRWQHTRFELHIEAALQTGLPLIIHTRNAAIQTLDILQGIALQSGEALSGVFHCFSEDKEVARKVLDMGFYISFSGILTYKNAEPLRVVAKYVPHDRCLTETDSPYLAPVPYRGQTNTPAYIPYIAQVLAEIWQVDVEEVGRLTSLNFERLFKI